MKPWIVPIPGTTRISRLEEDLGGDALVLPPADIARITGESAALSLQGARLPAAALKMTGL